MILHRVEGTSLASLSLGCNWGHVRDGPMIKPVTSVPGKRDAFERVADHG
jgi:hypothetical protein